VLYPLSYGRVMEAMLVYRRLVADTSCTWWIGPPASSNRSPLRWICPKLWIGRHASWR